MSYYETEHNHTIAEKIHAVNRARQRCGVSLTIQDVDSILKLIRGNKILSHKKISNTRTLFAVSYKGYVIYPLYSKIQKNIKTVLSEEMFNSIGT
jgi:hypothetical protein